VNPVDATVFREGTTMGTEGDAPRESAEVDQTRHQGQGPEKNQEDVVRPSPGRPSAPPPRAPTR
jgi:hypothetical protein